MSKTSKTKYSSIRSALKLLVDGAIAAIALFLAYQIRYDGSVPPERITELWVLPIPLAFLRMAIIFISGEWHRKWRYISASDAIAFAAISGLMSGGLVLARFTLPGGNLLSLPLGVIAVEYMLVVCASIGARLAWRLFIERRMTTELAEKGTRRILIIGAGFHGVTVAKEMVKQQSIEVIGFLDDDLGHSGDVIAGIPVLGTTDDLDQMVDRHHPDEVLLCVPPTERRDMKVSVDAGSAVRMSIVPTMGEIMGGDNMTASTPRKTRLIKTVRSTRRATTDASTESSIRDKTILITGGGGFIGSALAERLVEHNKLILFDLSFTTQPIKYSKLLDHPNVKLVEGDILQTEPLARLCQQAEMVVHTAAVLGVGRVCGAARETLETNYVGTSLLLQSLQHSNKLERFLYFSTSEVFGVDSYEVDESSKPSVGPITESRWSYAIAKLAGEHLVKSYHREAGMPTVIVRPFNVFGPRRFGDYALLRFVLNALAGRPLEVHGDGTQIRAWCYIDDFCDALAATLERPEAVGEDFNIGDDANIITIKDLAHKVVALSRSNSRVVTIPNPFPDISIRVPSLVKARRILDYNPRFDLDEGLLRTIRFYRDNWDAFASHKALTPTGPTLVRAK